MEVAWFRYGDRDPVTLPHHLACHAIGRIIARGWTVRAGLTNGQTVFVKRRT